MGEQNTSTATPPAPGGGPDISKAVAEAVASALKPLTTQIAAIEKNQGILADTLSKLPPAALAKVEKTDGDTSAGKPLTAEDVAKLIEANNAKLQTANQHASARQAFVTANLAKIPAVYHNGLGNDPAKWADEAKAIAAAYAADFKAAGGNPDLGQGGNTTTEVPDPKKLDASKMNDKQFADTYLPKTK